MIFRKRHFAPRLLTDGALMLLLAASLTACADRDDADDMDADTLGMQTDTTGMLGESMPMDMEGDTVEVSLTEYAIRMPSTIASGSTTFKITNEGTEEHGFEVEGQGAEEELPSHLQPGESATLMVNLQPGSYTAYCPVDDHRSQGMQTQFTVQESGTTAQGY